MHGKTTIIRSKWNNKIHCTAMAGHFATNHSHINYYIDLTEVKVQHKMSRTAAEELALRYQNIPLDTLLCLEGTEMVGAYLADALASNRLAMNTDTDIAVLAPELNTNNQMIFRENTQAKVIDKQVLLMVSIASTGKTINRALDCLQYYSAKLCGIVALFSAIDEKDGMPIRSVFSIADLPDYRTFPPSECLMCTAGTPIDAIANSYGYTRIR